MNALRKVFSDKIDDIKFILLVGVPTFIIQLIIVRYIEFLNLPECGIF